MYFDYRSTVYLLLSFSVIKAIHIIECYDVTIAFSAGRLIFYYIYIALVHAHNNQVKKMNRGFRGLA